PRSAPVEATGQARTAEAERRGRSGIAWPGERARGRVEHIPASRRLIPPVVATRAVVVVAVPLAIEDGFRAVPVEIVGPQRRNPTRGARARPAHRLQVAAPVPPPGRPRRPGATVKILPRPAATARGRLNRIRDRRSRRRRLARPQQGASGAATEEPT